VELDLEAQTQKRKLAREQIEYWATAVGVTAFCIFVMAVVLIGMMAAYRRAGNKQS
jgi:heme/copper-type cytochrome/quinol oxidase subunit 2